MPSAVIKRFEYRPDTRELVILFTTGRTYVYSDVPLRTVEEFKSAFKKGVYFNRHIRNRFAHRH